MASQQVIYSNIFHVRKNISKNGFHQMMKTVKAPEMFNPCPSEIASPQNRSS